MLCLLSDCLLELYIQTQSSQHLSLDLGMTGLTTHFWVLKIRDLVSFLNLTGLIWVLVLKDWVLFVSLCIQPMKLFLAKSHGHLLVNLAVITSYCTFHESLSSEDSFDFW